MKTTIKTINDGESCGHPGCLHHVTHPCEKCGRIAGRNESKKSESEMKITIKTRSIGNLEFSITKEGGCLKVWDNESKEMKQCMSEGFFGSPISSTSETIAKDARKWWLKIRTVSHKLNGPLVGPDK